MSAHRETVEASRQLLLTGHAVGVDSPHDSQNHLPTPFFIGTKAIRYEAIGVILHVLAGEALEGSGSDYRFKEIYEDIEAYTTADELQEAGWNELDTATYVAAQHLYRDSSRIIEIFGEKVEAKAEGTTLAAFETLRSACLRVPASEIGYLVSSGIITENESPYAAGGSLPALVALIIFEALISHATHYERDLTAEQLKNFALENLPYAHQMAARNMAHHNAASNNYNRMFVDGELLNYVISDKSGFLRVRSTAFDNTRKPKRNLGPTIQCPAEFTYSNDTPSSSHRLGIAIINLAYDRGLFDLSRYPQPEPEL